VILLIISIVSIALSGISIALFIRDLKRQKADQRLLLGQLELERKANSRLLDEKLRELRKKRREAAN
jgi:hypothetical protein